MIELGEAGLPPAPPAEAPLPIRKIVLAALAVLCLFLVTGSARPAPPLVRPLWRVPVFFNDATTLTADTAYLHRATPAGARLTAFDLATGAIRWSATTGQVVGYVEAAPAAGLVLVAADRQTVELPLGSPLDLAAEVTRATMALDARTGAPLWTAPGQVQAVDGSTALMSDVDDQGNEVRLRLIALRDHRTIWSVDTAGTQSHLVADTGGLPMKIVTVSAGGEIKIFRYADGKLLRTARIPWITPQPTAALWNDMTAIGDALVVNRSTQNRIEATVYRLDTMAEVMRIDGVRSFAFDCGAVVCISGNGGMAGYDASSFRRLWFRPGVVDARPAGPGRLLVGDNGEDTRQALIDAATGAVIGRPVQGTLIGDDRSAGARLVLHSVTSPPGRTSITRWDLATGQQHVLGTTDEILGSRCETVPHFLTCLRRDHYEVTAVS